MNSDSRLYLGIAGGSSYAIIANIPCRDAFIGEKRFSAARKCDISCSTFDQEWVFRPEINRPDFEEKMSTEMSMDIRAEPLTTAFKHWQNLAAGIVLMAISAYLTFVAPGYVTATTTELQGWVMLVIAGYLFASALYLGLSTISSHSPLAQTLPGVMNHFKGFFAAGIFYAVGYYLLNVETTALPRSQMLFQDLSLIIGGALFLVAAIVAVATAFTPHKERITK